jgi:hypothetical protein
MAVKKPVKKSKFPLDSEEKRKLKTAMEKSAPARKKQSNMSAIRDSGKEYNRRTEQGDVWDGPENARTVYTMYKGKSYFGETKKKSKKPIIKKK